MPLVSGRRVGLETDLDVAHALVVEITVAVLIDAADERAKRGVAVGVHGAGGDDQEPLGVPRAAADEARAVEAVIAWIFVLLAVVGAERRMLADARAHVVAAGDGIL